MSNAKSKALTRAGCGGAGKAAVCTALKPRSDREAVNHSAGEYVRGQAHTNGMESFRSMLARACRGTFRELSAKHLQRCIDAFAGKHDVRDADTIDQMRHLVAGMAGKRLTCAEPIADNGLPSGARSAWRRPTSGQPYAFPEKAYGSAASKIASAVRRPPLPVNDRFCL